MMKKKSEPKRGKGQNPFTMWGSYAGAAAGIPIAYFSFAIILHLAETGNFTILALLIPTVPVIAGFLAGWGLHSLARRLKNRKR